MAGKDTFLISRVELRHLMASFRISEKNIENIVSTMEKAHRHINVITLVSMLQNVGMSGDGIKELLRRVGMDDITISKIMEVVDEHRIIAESGRLFDAEVTF
jgi:hypothetical protein